MSAFARKALTILFDPMARSKRPSSFLAYADAVGAFTLDQGRRPTVEEITLQLAISPEMAVSLMDQLEVDRILAEQADGPGAATAIRKVEQAARCLCHLPGA